MALTVVSGATGRLGGRVARRLGGSMRLLVRDASRAPAIPGATVAVADYADGAAVRAALTGASTVLMVSGAETPERVAQHRSFIDAAASITAVTGREVRYHNETIEEAYASRARYEAPRWQVDAWVSTYTAIAAGELAGVSDAVPSLSNHPATSIVDLLTRQP